LLAGYLNSKGINITALEPGLGGFSVSTALADAVAGSPEFKTLKRLNVSAEELSQENFEVFDFIYSVNVLEHIPELEKAIQGMRNVLTNQGKMMHTCPNYTVPYEPHFGIPLIPFFPRLTPFIYSQCKNSELWDSFNFITASQIKRICSRNAMNIRFDAGVLHRSFLRLEEDSEFLKRQSNSLVGTIFKILKSTGLINITRFIPAKLATPMVFVITTKQKT
jgi:SAM-dependent methyltransferase